MLIERACGAVILWLLERHMRRSDGTRWSHWKWNARSIVNSGNGQQTMWRFEPLWPDEVLFADGRRYNRPPWWRPFNALLHRWVNSDPDSYHDHPRWSVTVCLRGSMIEHTPWKSMRLRPGSIVVRSRKAIHRFEVLDPGRTWTLFIVGRRNHPQNIYRIKRIGDASVHRKDQEWA